MNESFDEIVTPEERELFDHHLDRVLAAMPPEIHQLLEEVPLIVDDFPSDELLDEMGIDDPGELCGLHDGIPLTERHVEHPPSLPESISIFRDGILNAAAEHTGHVSIKELERQIRITILHEIGHHFGLTEEDLIALGYG